LTGLRDNNIRSSIRPYLRDEKSELPDEELLQILSLAVADEIEHTEKVSSRKKEVNIQLVEQEKVVLQPKKESPLLSELKELKVHVQELAAVREDVENLKQSFNSNNRSNCNNLSNYQSRSNFKQNRCPNCRVTKSKCDHCFICGSSEHRRSDCPHNRYKKN